VGGPQARKLAEAFKGRVELILSNTGEGEGGGLLLNEGVGAEHCQKGRLPPAGFTAASHVGARCASLDGDADRLVYHTFAVPATVGGAAAAAPVWRLLDGDKIAVLAAAWLGATLKEAGFVVTGQATHGGHGHGVGDAWAVPSSSGPPPDLSSLTSAPLSVGIVQTAYANGAASHHVRSVLGLPCLLAKTGVKYVHSAAAAFDVGVYFEANGHGTVLMHPTFLLKLQAVQAASDTQLEEVLGSAGARAAARRLAAGSVLINQAIGDALSDAMFVEAVLASLDWSVADWDALYEDLPSRQAKLPVADRSAVRTVEDESRLTAPLGLQEAIDALVAAVPSGRAFVRPSGTEDVVRVYAEGASEAAADALALAVSRAVYDHAGGVGVRP
jgi:phosphoacetylglucosamine mutase